MSETPDPEPAPEPEEPMMDEDALELAEDEDAPHEEVAR